MPFKCTPGVLCLWGPTYFLYGNEWLQLLQISKCHHNFFFFNFMDEVFVLFIPNNESNRIELVETYLDLLMLIGSNDKDSILLMSILVPSNYRCTFHV